MKIGKNEEPVINCPIPINIKRGENMIQFHSDINIDRFGLGAEESKRRKIEKNTDKKSTESKVIIETFKSRMSSRFTDKKILLDVKKALVICKDMDLEKNILESKFYKKDDEKEEYEKENGILVEADIFLELLVYTSITYFELI
jgi:hypothetical protein